MKHGFNINVMHLALLSSKELFARATKFSPDVVDIHTYGNLLRNGTVLG